MAAAAGGGAHTSEPPPLLPRGQMKLSARYAAARDTGAAHGKVPAAAAAAARAYANALSR